MPWPQRAAIFIKAAELITKKYRYILNAATILGQSKSFHQAEIDSSCELADFFRFNAYYLNQIYSVQPRVNASGNWNKIDYRSLEGFVYAITPFNFTAIGGNLSSAPAMAGNVVLWKPSSTAVLSGYYLMLLFEEAGLPPGVINFLPGSGSLISEILLSNKHLAGIHFTGSTRVFNDLWKKIGENIDHYRSYPKIVGETGGKNFVVAHKSADVKALAVALCRGAFEYQGQKCSAASRAYVSEGIWPQLKKELNKNLSLINTGQGAPEEGKFFNALIDEKSFTNASNYIEQTKKSEDAKIIFGGKTCKDIGYFVEPTIILAETPDYLTMVEEIFAPILTIYVYHEDQYVEILEKCDSTSPYALSGAVFANNREAIIQADNLLRNAAGNFYINDKPTGSVVGQQPFGGARGSGTNDKAGSAQNLSRWISPRTIKENFAPERKFNVVC